MNPVHESDWSQTMGKRRRTRRGRWTAADPNPFGDPEKVIRFEGSVISGFQLTTSGFSIVPSLAVL